MVAELRIDPSDRVLDNESSEGSVGGKLFRASPFGFRDGRATCQSSNSFWVPASGKFEADFLQAELLRESTETNL
jgi:hypothetical protein